MPGLSLTTVWPKRSCPSLFALDNDNERGHQTFCTKLRAFPWRGTPALMSVDLTDPQITLSYEEVLRDDGLDWCVSLVGSPILLQFYSLFHTLQVLVKLSRGMDYTLLCRHARSTPPPRRSRVINYLSFVGAPAASKISVTAFPLSRKTYILASAESSTSLAHRFMF